MKLVAILARELKVWPEGVSKLTQSFAGMVFYQDSAQQIVPLGRMEISEDFRDEYVTRAEWQAAVDALNAPKVADIKWPDGAEFVGTGDSEGFDPFYRNITDDSYEVLCSDSLWRKLGGTPAFTPLTPRPAETELDKSAPKVVEWDGVGLPPVGAVCAVLNSDLGNPTWERCTILYSGKHRVMYDSESCEERVAFIENLTFRKARTIRTAEQVAAEEREKAVYQIRIDGDLNRTDAERLYKAGYRKQVVK